MKHTIKLEFDQYLLEHLVVVIFFDKKINKLMEFDAKIELFEII